MNGIKMKNIEGAIKNKINPKKPSKTKEYTDMDFNFFQPYLGKEKKQKNKILYISIIFGAMLFISAATTIWNYTQISNTKKEIEQMNKVINSPKSKEILKQGEKLNKKYDILKKYYSGVSSITTNIYKKEIINSDLMNKVSLSLPTSVSFKSMTLNGNTIQIQGVAANRVNIAEFQYNLKQLQEIKDVQVMTINQNYNADTVTNVQNGNCNFTLKCTLKDVDENEN